jgi:hypothetical protein
MAVKRFGKKATTVPAISVGRRQDFNGETGRSVLRLDRKADRRERVIPSARR